MKSHPWNGESQRPVDDAVLENLGPAEKKYLEPALEEAS